MSSPGPDTAIVPPPAPAPAGPSRRPAGLDVPGPSPARLVAVELRKAVDTTTGRWLQVVALVLVLGALALAAVFPPDDRASLQWLLTTGLLPVSLLVPVLGVLLVSGEFSTRSVLTTFALVPSRAKVVAAKVVAAVALAVAWTVGTVVLAVAAGGLVDLVGVDLVWSLPAEVLAQVLVAQVVYVLVGVGFGLLCQNTPLAVITYLVVPSLVSPVFMLVPALQDIGPWVDLSAGTGALLMSEAASAREWAQVGTVTALWAGLPFVLGWLRLRRRDLA